MIATRRDPDASSLTTVRRALRDIRPVTPDQLHGYCRAVLGLDVPRRATTSGSSAPFDYLCHAFFETSAPRDCVVWANRGGGKTMLGAAATLLDLVFKPGIQIRILGGSLEQADKMYEYLRQMAERPEFVDLVDGRLTSRRITMVNGSGVEVLAQSEQSIRGQRVQKLRCDEIELFSDQVWQAAQYVTRSAWCGETFVPGCIEAFSTMHRPFGLMRRLVTDGNGSARRIFKWTVIEVLQTCPPSRPCETCALWPECGGIAKSGRGFLSIEDALQQKARSSGPAWASEMLCRRPGTTDAVYPEFDMADHIQPFVSSPVASPSGTGIGGMDFGFRNPTVYLWAHVATDGSIHIVDEHVARETTIQHHIDAIRARGWPAPDWVGIDPAGLQRHEHLGTSTAALLKRAGFTLRHARTNLETGIEFVRARLRTADGRVRLRIDPRCRILIEAMQRYHYPTGRSGIVDDAASYGSSGRWSDPVKDGPDHACDALRYLVVNLDRPTSPTTVRSYL